MVVKNRKTMAYMAAVLSMSVALTACGSKEEKKESTKGPVKQTLNLMETDEIPTMNHTKATDPVAFNVMNNVMEGLYRNGENDKLEPGIAKEHEVSKDGKTYTFKLREDAKWSNGDPVTAKDFVYAWQKLVDPNTAAEYAYIAFDIKNAENINQKKGDVKTLGVTAKDDHTLVVELEQPVTYFPKLMTFPVFYPINEKFEKAQGDKFGLEANTTLYNGPFVLSEWKHEASFEMKKNKDYWDKKTVKLDEIDFKIIKEPSTASNLYETDALDRVTLSADLVDKYKGNSELKKIEIPSVVFLRFNQNNEALKNKNVRKAISMSFDKKAIVDTLLNDGSKPTDYYVTKEFMKDEKGDTFRGDTKDYVKKDEKEVKALWEKAKKEVGKETIELTLLNYDKEPLKKIGEYLKTEMEKQLPGLKVNIKQVPLAQKLKLEKGIDYDISISSWTSDYPDPMNFLDMYVTGSANNRTAFASPEYDAKIKEIKTTLANEPEKRWKAMEDLEKMLLDEAVIAPMYVKGQAYVEKEKVKDIYDHSFGGPQSYKWAHIEE